VIKGWGWIKFLNIWRGVLNIFVPFLVMGYRRLPGKPYDNIMQKDVAKLFDPTSGGYDSFAQVSSYVTCSCWPSVPSPGSRACSWLVPPQVEASSGSNIFGNSCEDNSVVNSSHRPCHDASLRVLCSNRCITLIPSLIYMRHYGEVAVPQVDPPTTALISPSCVFPVKGRSCSYEWNLVRSVDYKTHPNRVCHSWLGNWWSRPRYI